MMFEHWRKPELFPESREFLSICPVPVYIVSNIDTEDLEAALEFNELRVNGLITSKDARAYKPHPLVFKYALDKAGILPNEAVHIGDSLSSDVAGAEAARINAVWLNRHNKTVPADVKYSITRLTDLFDLPIWD